jgi:hypothetical protein
VFCSFHGELFALCEERGLEAFDRFESVVVSDLLHCEACSVPPEQAEQALAQIYLRGGVSLEAFWEGVDGAPDGDGPSEGVELIAAWTLDDRIADRISERWPELSARYAFAFRALQPGTGEDLVTGFLLFVDLSRERAVAIIEPTSESWTAFNTAQHLGPWQELYAKR